MKILCIICEGGGVYGVSGSCGAAASLRCCSVGTRPLR
jgi:hypothetical protein